MSGLRHAEGVDRWVAAGWSYLAPGSPVRVSHPGWHTPSWLLLTEVYAALAHFGIVVEGLSSEFRVVLRVMEEFAKPFSAAAGPDSSSGTTTNPRASMGIEYSLKFANADQARVTALLRSLPGARERESWFDLGVSDHPDDWPTATVQADPEGAYFNDNCGGGGPEQLGVVVAWLVGEFGPVTVEEL